MCRRLSFLVYQATFSLKPRNREVYLSLSLSLSVFLSLPVSLALSLSLFFSLAFLCFLCLACLEQGSTTTGSRSIRRHQSPRAPPLPLPFRFCCGRWLQRSMLAKSLMAPCSHFLARQRRSYCRLSDGASHVQPLRIA